ncbi:MAG TPA: lipoprotein insertase outer membrane protein LolB [Luteimonas sp.]|nr:lipoprotein insertase outer membrane protein LolB [Luteimonas sp.]
MRLAGCACLAACLALAGCVSVPAGKGVAVGELPAAEAAAAMQRQQAREQRLAALPALSFDGRVALSNGRNGGSGRIEWRQRGDAYDVTLSAPVSRQSWRLEGDAASARIEGVEGGPRSDTDVVRLLREATGLEIPVGALAAWASGARADAAAFGPARLGFAADGRLARIEQGGWTVDYLAWRDADIGDGRSSLAVPARIDAHRGQAKVRLAIDAWSWAP